MTRRTLGQMRASARSDPRASALEEDLADGSAVCDCDRRRRRCSASAPILSQTVTRHRFGPGSRVVVCVVPRPNQCPAVAVCLEESATIANGPQRIGHPLQQAMQSTTGIDRTNGSTPATRLGYRAPEEQIECWVRTSRGRPGAAATSAQAQGAAEGEYRIRAAWQREYRDCLADGGVYAQLPADARLAACERIRQAKQQQG